MQTYYEVIIKFLIYSHLLASPMIQEQNRAWLTLKYKENCIFSIPSDNETQMSRLRRGVVLSQDLFIYMTVM